MLTNTFLNTEIESFKTIIEQLDKVFFIYDAQYEKMLYVSPAFDNLWGFHREVLLQNSSYFIETIHLDDRKDVLKHKASFLDTKEKLEEAYRIFSPDGTVRWISATTIPIFKAGGELHQIAIVAEDISKQKQLEGIFHVVEKASKVGVWEFDLSNKKFTITEGAYAICGLPLGYELSYKEALDILLPSSKIQLFKKLNKAFESAKCFRLDLGIVTEQKSTVFLKMDVKPWCNNNGFIYKLTGTVQDITPIKENENRLIKDKIRAEEAAYAQSISLSTMSHEIRTPMNAVIGMTHLLLDEQPKPSQITHLRTLKFSAENLMVLINDILDYNKLESGKFTFEHAPFSLEEVVEDVKDAFTHRAKDKNISINLKLDTQVPSTLNGDKVRLAQVLNNLVGNAIKFTERGGVAIDIETREINQKDALIYFSVADTGIGIPKDKQDAIFEQFTQASTDISRKYGGTGLGLPIAKKLLKLQGSDLFLHSVERKGATFHFELSFGIVDEANKGITTPTTKVYDLNGIEILLVEDNKINQLVAQRFLEKWGAKIDIEEDGASAVRKVQEKVYDIVLMDLEMPIMNGYEATRLIRKLGGSYEKLPIIALTASAMQDVKEKVVRVGMDDYAQKPFHPDEFYDTVSRYSRSTHKSDISQTKGENDAKSSTLWKPEGLFSIINGSEEFFDQFYQTAQTSLLEFIRVYEVTLFDHDVRAFRQNVHKAKSVLKLLGAEPVIEEMAVGRALVENSNAGQNKLQLSVERIRGYIVQIFREMEEKKPQLLSGESS